MAASSSRPLHPLNANQGWRPYAVPHSVPPLLDQNKESAGLGITSSSYKVNSVPPIPNNENVGIGAISLDPTPIISIIDDSVIDPVLLYLSNNLGTAPQQQQQQQVPPSIPHSRTSAHQTAGPLGLSSAPAPQYISPVDALLNMLYGYDSDDISIGVIDIVNALCNLPAIQANGFYPGEGLTLDGHCPTCNEDLQ
jgi:hypothetical protein